jgi:hypothetical protein
MSVHLPTNYITAICIADINYTIFVEIQFEDRVCKKLPSSYRLTSCMDSNVAACMQIAQV